MEPSENAKEVAVSLLEADELQREVLVESAETGEESGRTVCGSEAVEPSNRGFRHVELPGCAMGEMGMMHGGGGHDFDAPEHSLIDMAIVLYEDRAASLVVGRQESDLFMEPSEESSEKAQNLFSEALGQEVHSPDDVAQAIKEGNVSPPAVRERFRASADDLFRVVRTEHQVEPMVDVEPSPQVAPGASAQSTTVSGVTDSLKKIASDVWEMLTEVFSFDPRDVNVNLMHLLVSEVAGALVLLLFLKVFGGSPKQMVAS